ncbi:hypothetical protein [Enterococcus sp. AD013-P3]|uniref:hypothetical protein n=1 Tax=Enterococcus sp. AD013-P3 TaxID=3411036 RepID=UPI003B94A034
MSILFWSSIILTLVIAYFSGNSNSRNKILNYALLFFLIIDFLFIGTFLVENVPALIKKILDYLSNMTSSLDVVILVALITGLVSLLNSFYSRYSDNKNKRREYLSAKREEPYSEFIELVYKLTQNEKSESEYNNEQMGKDINSFNSKLTLWGSPKVVKKWNIFRKNSLEGNSEVNPEKNLILIEEVMNQMRKDLGVKPVGKGNLLSFFVNDIEKIIGKKK